MAKRFIYCHFSFRRPREKAYGLFAVALYSDFEGKRLIAQKTRAFKLWKNHQHITAIQAYEHAMYCLWEWQSKLKEHGITNILLVTDNSTLAGWILDPGKNKAYTPTMLRAMEAYKVGGPREIYLPVGLCEPRDAEKSHKFCREDLVVNKIPTDNDKSSSEYRLDISNSKMKTALDIIMEDTPEGLNDLKELK